MTAIYMIKHITLSTSLSKQSSKIPSHKTQIDQLQEKNPRYMKYIKLKCKQYQIQDEKKCRFPIHIHKCQYTNTQNTSNNIQDISDLHLFTQNVYDVLRESNLNCFYCKKNVYIEYTNENRMYQWTLDRIDNSKNHDINNCVIACLSCNLKRRNINSTKYKMTKQLNVEKENN